MNRPQVGTNPTLTRRDSESYLAFVEGIHTYIRGMAPAVKSGADRAFQAYERRTGHPARNVDEAFDAIAGVPVVASRMRLRRSVQEMNHDAIIADLGLRETELLAELDRADQIGPGSVAYDPKLSIPDYARREIHLLPGGYVKNPLAGYWYHASTKQFFMGNNDHDQMHQSAIDKLPLPADGVVRRVLDLGCSAGQSATALKRRFPDAEVWGIDIGIPMIRYAHKRAVDMGLDVHFKQALAERTGFPDNHFDIVHAFILYHELPLDIGEAVAREAVRILRPGGLFLVLDFQSKYVKRGDARDSGDPGMLGEVLSHVDTTDNEEPYEWDFVHSDFEGMLGRYFARVEARPEGGLPLRVATKAG
jgi:ubiquinone/menaquinone biosynthesis C-methylase UbiE